jgi:hypothetical protein
MKRFSVRQVPIAATILACCLAAGVYAAATKDTPVPADGQCNFVNFHYDEAKNAKDPANARATVNVTACAVASRASAAARPGPPN